MTELSDVDPADLQNRLDFETLISEVSARLIAAANETLAPSVVRALEESARFFGADRSQLFSLHDPGPEIRVVHAWCADTATSSQHPVAATNLREEMPWAADVILTRRQALVVSALDDLPPEAQRDRASFQARGVRSAAWVSVAVGAEVRYLVTIEATRTEVHWPTALVPRLPRLCGIMAHAVERQCVTDARGDTRDRITLALTARTLAEADYRATIARLEAAVAAAGLGFNLMTPPGETPELDDRARDLLGVPPDQESRVRSFWLEHVHPDDRDGVIEASREVMEKGVDLSRVYRYQHPTRGLVWYRHTVRTFERDPTGRLTRVAGVVQDITEQKRIEWELRQREARLEIAADLAGLGFYETDFATGCTFVDRRCRDLTGIPPELSEDTRILDFWIEHVHPDDRPRLLDLRRRMHSEGLDRASLEYRFFHPSRGERWLQHVSTVAGRDSASGAIRTLGILRDITESKRAEEELTTLSRHLIQAQEAERALIARDLHDDVTQRMAVLAIELGRSESSADGGALAATLRTVREGLVRLSEDIHSIAYQLHPSVLEELGLVEALRAECERRERHGGLGITLDLDPVPAVVGKAASRSLYRVAQEALSNVSRHARARMVNVALRRVDGGLLLAVRDDGVGFDPRNVRARGSLGLVSMRERLRLVNGTLDVESAPGQGTGIVAWVPGEGDPP